MRLKKFFKWVCFFIFYAFSMNARAIYPMYSYFDLVAGESSVGYKDGPFYQALFHSPWGMALDSSSTQLYVADTGNHCIRLVDLAHGNQVSTVVGTGKSGSEDGDFSKASFNSPKQLVWVDDNRLVVNDDGDQALRLVDLNKKTVSTLAKVGGIWNIVYFPGRDEIYFTASDGGTFRKLNLKTREVSVIFQGRKEISQPSALCYGDGSFYISDLNSGDVYRLTPKASSLKAKDLDFEWTPIGKGSYIMAMAYSTGQLYALQRDDKVPFVRLGSTTEPIRLVSQWGYHLDDYPNRYLLLEGSSGPIPFLADPLSVKKFYIGHPLQNIVTSYRDIRQGELSAQNTFNSDGISDYQYPLAKPPGVFRILLLGDSRSFHYDDGYKSRELDLSMSTLSGILPKRLELCLNTLASLNNVPTHFEVLDAGQPVFDPLTIWTYYLGPDLAKKFDCDMVLIMLTNNVDLNPYFGRPLTSEGIPGKDPDMEFYLKPIKERLQGAPKEFLDLCLSKKLVSIDSTGRNPIFADPVSLVSDPQVCQSMVDLYSKPMKLLNEKLKASKNKQGNPIQLAYCYWTLNRLNGIELQQPFWDGVLKESGALHTDLTPLQTALRLSFYPYSEIGDNDHMFMEGHMLIGMLLAQQLIKDKIIPFESNPK